VFSAGLMVPESIAVDWVGRNLYWTDSVMENIEVSTLDGAFRKVLLSKNVTSPRGLVLDPRTHINIMFWSDWGQNPRIERADLDGAMRRVIVSTKLYWPNGLALDYTTRRVYFADAYLKYIDYCDYEGNGRQQVMVSDLHPHGMTVFEDHVYWSERYTSRVMRTNKFHGGNTSVLMNSVYQPMGLAMRHPVKQPPATNPCENHPCTQLCLLSGFRPRFYNCHCQSGWTLGEDRLTCVKDDKPFLMVVRQSVILGVPLDTTDTTNNAMAPVSGITQGRDIEFDDQEQFVYWVQSTVSDRKLFWTDKGLDSGVPPKVSSADMDGGNPRNLFSVNLIGVGAITADIGASKLYWAVANRGLIESGSMDGTNRMTVVASLSLPWGLSVHQGHLYYTDADYEVVERVDKEDGTNMVVMRSGMVGLRALKVHARDDSAGSSNACSSNNGGCPHLCLPRPDNQKTCACTTGFVPSQDGASCQQYESYAIVSTARFIRGFHINSSDHSEAMVPVGGYSSSKKDRLDVHIESNFVYWTENSTSTYSRGIYRAKTDGSQYSRFLHTGVGRGGIQGIAVDWIAGNLYFTNAFTRQTYLEVVAINTTNRLVLLKASEEDRPRDLAVSPKLRLLFWTDGGQNPKIERALLDGTNRTVLASGAMGSPRGLTVDYSSDFLYWTDDMLDTVSRMDVDGKQRAIVRGGGGRLPSPMGMAIFGGYVLWVDRKLGKLFQASKDPAASSQPPEVIREGLDGLSDVAVFDPHTQPTAASQVGFNPCLQNNGGCQQLCFAFPGRAEPQCACAHGSLLGNGSTCGYGQDEFLIFTTDFTLNSLRLDPADHSSPFPTATLGSTLLALDYDYAAKRLFYVQYMGIGRSRIGYVSTVAMTSPPVILAANLDYPQGLAYDWVHKRLYWTDYRQSNIQAIGMEGGNRTIVAQANRPKAIIVDPCYGYLYWCDWEYPAKIERATLGGNYRTTIISGSLSAPNGLTLDVEERMLYWTDSNLDKIERSTLTGQDRQVVLHGAQYPFALTVHRQDLFWTDWATRSIYRAAKDDGSGVTVLAQDLQYRPNDVHVYTQAKQATCASPCQQFNGGCSHVCVAGPSGPECQCPQQGSWYLANNGKDCVRDSGTHCSAEQFTCLSGACISVRWKCDGVPDCQDQSDELERVCAFHTCSALDFTCDSGRCVPLAYACDYTDDCGDNSDERGCPFPTCSPVGEFTCASGRCISADFVCDGFNDCRDNDTSDEINCPDRTCPSGMIKCENTNICITSDDLCDGYNDCGDNSDEDSIFCEARTCSSDEFRCDKTVCIPSIWVCDSYTDCLDGTDEPASCEGQVNTCSSSQFICTNGNCVPQSVVCDGGNDCSDNSDEAPELQCGERNCSSSQFTCPTWLSGYPRCIPLAYVCDNHKDCANAADELQQCPNRTCHMNEFTCTNSLCILIPFHCDHVNDCGDGSDERDCTYEPCTTQQFTCGNGACVPAGYVCDGEADCLDGSDEAERLCVTPEPTCAPLQYACTSGQCVDAGKVCNGRKDCEDNSDEKGCGINECRSPSVHKCAQVCTDTLTGYYCSCDPGYRLMADGKACTDLDECRDTPAVCSQLCDNVVGSFHCQCAPGYLREPDGRTCRQNSGVAPYLLYSNRYYVRNLTADGSQLSVVAQGLSNAVALDFHHQEKTLYWLDAGLGRIERMRLDGDGSRETLVDSKLGGAQGLAVDWVGRKVYWVDSYFGSVHVMELDGRYQKKLLTGEIPGANATYLIVRPRAVALNPKHGWLYWTDWGDSPYVGRAGMDGSSAGAIITAKLAWPSGLTVDYTTNKIFFADAHLNFLDDLDNFADMDGQNRHRAVGGSLPHVFAVTLFEDWLYWTDWNTHTVEKAHKYTGAGRTMMGNNTHRPYDIHVYHPYRQPRSVNPCETHGLTCSHMCLIAPGGAGATCECPDHFIGLMVGFTIQCVADCSSTQFRCGDNENEGNSEQQQPNGHMLRQTCPPRTCPIGQFQCLDMNCTYPGFLCDGDSDCPDGSDEDPALCSDHRCLENQFQCQNKHCIPVAWHCDGFSDCSDDSDEDPDGCAQKTCGPGQFRCDNGRCVPSSYVCDRCDGTSDCLDQSDEEGCEHVTCDPMGDFRCDNHLCVPIRWQCDGNNDCGDGSDERQCDLLTCRPGFFQCDSGHCVPEALLCDGRGDCEDFSDESKCPTRFPGGRWCPVHQFECDNHLCVSPSWVCDGQDDCGDRSDELLSLCLNISCEMPSRFRCDNNYCVYAGVLCNLQDDCGDGKEPTLPPCTLEEFKCTNGHCVEQPYLCDHNDNCSGLNRSCAENVCHQLCTSLSGTGFICSYVDECQVYATCPQGCKNTKGGYECKCSPGYRSAGTGDLCEAYGPGMVYFTVAGKGSTWGAIKRAYLPTDDYGSPPLGLAVNLDLKFITTPDGIAVDWVGGNLYWADSSANRLEVAMLDGRYRKQLVTTDLGHPSAVAVNPRLGMLYWADRGSVAKIECSWLDGQQRKVLVADGLGWPTGLSVDFTNGDRLYWSDSKENRIESVLPSGGDRQIAVYIAAGNPLSVSVFENHIYWSTRDKGEVFRQDKFGHGTKVKLLTAGPWLTQISVHLCLLRPGGYTCACPEGTLLITGSNTECDAGFDPTPTMPPFCMCQNGFCYPTSDDKFCKCLPGWKGEYLWLAVGLTVLLAVILVCLIAVCKKKPKLMATLRITSLPSMPGFSVSCAPLDSWACPRPRRHQDSSTPRCLDYTSSPVLTP
ncbi:hypothetical protein NHX12_024429, partial [Muraenolepis orangiensis]